MTAEIADDSQAPGTGRQPDRRDYKRVQAELLCALVLADGGRYPAMTRNLSLGGVFLECERSLAKGDAVRVSLNLQLGGRLRKVEADGRVVHGPTRVSVTAYGLGIGFESVDEEGRELLEQYIDARPEL